MCVNKVLPTDQDGLRAPCRCSKDIPNAHRPEIVLRRALDAIAPNGSVRTLEALAAVLARREREPQPLQPSETAASRAASSQPFYRTESSRAPCSPARDSKLKVDEAVRQRISKRALRGALKDPTDGATHFHAVGSTPPWAAGRNPCAIIGDFFFYKVVD